MVRLINVSICSMKDPGFIQELISRCMEAKDRVQKNLGELTPAQLNWKPSEEAWSIGQCLEHLVISDTTYFHDFKKIAEHTYEMSRWQKGSPLSNFFGRMLLSQVGERPRKKFQAPRIFRPPERTVDPGIFDRYSKHIDTLVEYMALCREMDLDKILLRSPVSAVVTYSLRHAFQLLVQHLQRHILQAEAVRANKEFPGSH